MRNQGDRTEWGEYPCELCFERPLMNAGTGAYVFGTEKWPHCGGEKWPQGGGTVHHTVTW